ncbi:MAG TPA: nucleotide disphospho-sugar-binding domain-containing protein [Kofleriaceae bacterium]|jgi:MGT family glycosyltransferase
MSRFLFAVPPLTGHTNPTIAVAQALEARGHEVAWVGHPGKIRPLLPAGARLFALDDRVAPELVTQMTDRSQAMRGAAALKFLWEDFLVPLARQMRPGIDAAVAEYAPDVMCVDQQAVAGGLVARKRGIPWASLATTSAGVTDPLAGLPQVKRWFEELIAQLEREAEVPPAAPVASAVPMSPELSPHLVIAFTTPALVGDAARFPAHYRFVGPSLGRPEAAEFPWDQLGPRPRVLVSMGTVNAEASGRFYGVALAALGASAPAALGASAPGDPPIQVILAAPPHLLPAELPPNVLARAYVPQLALLSHVDAVVCHGGHNTTCEALAHGLPLVIAPIKDDQPIVADQVVAAGAGLRVKFGRVQAPELRDAVHRVLHDSSFREAAGRIRDSFAAAGGAVTAAAELEKLA